MKRIVVLGGGRVGRVIARDLSERPDFGVTVCDASAERLADIAGRHRVETVQADLARPDVVAGLARSCDLVVGALPGFLGLQTMSAVISAKRPLVDISFLPEDPRVLDQAAKDAGVVVLYDIGVAPGSSNVLIAAAARELRPLRHVRYVVGGLPVERQLPWEYQAPFSPIDVIEEYTRPARFKMGGQIFVRPALSDVERFHIPGVGTLEGFLTDGLRSLLDTIDCPSMEEKTLRYPGHAERIQLLRDAGFFDDRMILVKGHPVRAVDFTFALLEPAWRQSDDAEELTVLRIEVTGGADGDERRIVWDLLDRTDRVRGETSMSRTTGFPAAIAARCLVDGSTALLPGVHPPEALGGDPAFVAALLGGLAERGVRFTRREERLARAAAVPG